MAIQTINLGTYANDGTGDDLRTAFQKVNANLVELYSISGGANIGSVPPISGVEEGELWWSTVEGRLYIYYGSSWIDASPVDGNVTYNLTSETVTGGAAVTLTGTDLSTDSIKFASSTNITVTRTDENTITLSSTSYTGNITGNVTGNVSGNAGTVTNGVYTSSSINALADVDTVSVTPTNGQTLVWNSGISQWKPGTIAPGGVTKILAGTNITISPTNGLGEVTVNSTASGGGGGGSLDFGTFTVPAGFTLDMGTF